jgi:hypothetical protein
LPAFLLSDYLRFDRGRPLGHPPSEAQIRSWAREYFFARALPPRRPASFTVTGLDAFVILLSVYLALSI